MNWGILSSCNNFIHKIISWKCLTSENSLNVFIPKQMVLSLLFGFIKRPWEHSILSNNVLDDNFLTYHHVGLPFCTVECSCFFTSFKTPPPFSFLQILSCNRFVTRVWYDTFYLSDNILSGHFFATKNSALLILNHQPVICTCCVNFQIR